ncbi:MAG: hypothetical protein QM237_10865 [Bacteroidota bacterium]|jgi:hypothetical protein|nr:hypothetical protein [Bacteroidota bacterium]HHU96841.1 hypothetical protein [Petrimonas sp.]
MTRLFKIITNWFKIQRLRFQMRPARLKRAIKKANRLHERDGKRYRVFFFGDRYHVWNRMEIRRRQASGLLKRSKKAGEDFDGICFHDTNANKN